MGAIYYPFYQKFETQTKTKKYIKGKVIFLDYYIRYKTFRIIDHAF